ncbi:calcium-binding protein, partial [Sphingomonas sp.]|uniref:beta strand repeat-containing protein n=1 Tax=Sphingomonas sp. TaxID=28214 RepID=UPI0025FD1F2C
GNDQLSGIENLIGSAYYDVLAGSNDANLIDGGAGADTMRGQGGDDTYIVDDTGDRVLETSSGGTDTVQSSVSYTLGNYVENLTLTGSAAIDGTGNSLANVLTGNSAANVLTGGNGNDTYIIQNVDDQVVETSASGGVDTVQSSISYALGANVENLTLTGTALDGTGNGLRNVIIGNGSANVLDGGVGADTLEGGFGDDTYVVDNSGDRIIEPHNDLGGTLYGGNDLVQSSVSWKLGADLENLTLTGTAAINGTGNDSANTIIGNSAANVINGGVGADTMKGGAGNDTYIVDYLLDSVVELTGEGIDTVKSSISYVLGANVENLALTGTGAINGTGNALANTIFGNGAANVIDGGAGADIMKGGAGDDVYIVDNSGDRVSETSAGGHDGVQSSVSFALGSYIEDLTLTGTASVNGTGNDLDNSIVGNSGNNILDGRGGADTMNGGAGDDTYVVDNVNDTIFDLDGGNDTVKSSISFSLEGLVYADIENLTLTGTANINATGTQGANVIIGNSGDNVINGNTGGDTLKGGAGNDTYIVYGADDQVIEGFNAGVDTVDSHVSYTLTINVENLTLEGQAANGTGNNLDNTIVGTVGDNVLDGKGGADILEGEGGNDTYIIDNPGDRILYSDPAGDNTVISSISYTLGTNLDNLVLSGTNSTNGTGNALQNVIFGNDAVNVLSGAGGDDYLDGAGGNDKLSGGDGNDILIGGAGIDTLSGGAGTDVFGFDAAPASTNVGTITDFSATEDTIALSQSAFGGLALGDLSASAFQAGTSATSSATRIIYDKASGDIYFDPDGTGSAGKVLFAKVTAGTILSASNFYVVDLSSSAQPAGTVSTKVAAGQAVPHAETGWIGHWQHANDFEAHLHSTLSEAHLSWI